jgi:hypothetical protein
MMPPYPCPVWPVTLALLLVYTVVVKNEKHTFSLHNSAWSRLAQKSFAWWLVVARITMYLYEVNSLFGFLFAWFQACKHDLLLRISLTGTVKGRGDGLAWWGAGGGWGSMGRKLRVILQKRVWYHGRIIQGVR